jgi:hypothetical protein
MNDLKSSYKEHYKGFKIGGNKIPDEKKVQITNLSFHGNSSYAT